MKTQDNLNYHNYLKLDRVLNSQSPQSQIHGNLIHDEMLFIIVHQVYELWFKQILHEIESIQAELAKIFLNDNELFKIVSRMQRIIKIQNLMLDQMKIIETMTPMDFMEFRDLLGSSSGLQSFQFRVLEIKLGVQYDQSSPFFSALPLEQKNRITELLASPSLFDLMEKWLERNPFMKTDHFSFWQTYHEALEKNINQQKAAIANNPLLSPEVKQQQMQQLEISHQHFNALLDDCIYDQLLKKGERRLSRLASGAALFIYLYRDESVFQLPYMFLTTLIEVDELLGRWRYAHLLMVKKMLGSRMGTGGTLASGYLMQAASSREVFKDLTSLASFIVKKSDLNNFPNNKHK